MRNLALAGAALVLYYGFVSSTGTGIPCLFRYFTHLQCAGCGATRMLIALGHGRLGEAYAAHPVLLAASPFLLWIVGRLALSYARGGSLALRRWEKAGLWALTAILVLFFVWRNLPALRLGWPLPL
ncbi:MAG: DUF2752 domain-containing protein [Eubacteriales bacterium]|nr:DUF2752 domain-containing protein [Eubacteriales bacterium]